MLQEDLADAGRYADFHALRHSTGSLLALAGVHPKVAQSIMRHSDINLTMSQYTHVLRGQESDAVESLPDLTLPSSSKQKATGTNDKTVLASSLALQGGKHRTAMNNSEQTKPTGDLKTPIPFNKGGQTLTPNRLIVWF